MKKLICLIISLSFLLSSCAVYNGICSLLGFDRKNYTKQEINYYIDLNTDEKDEIELLKCLTDEMEYLLCAEQITPFDGSDSPVEYYNDALLDGMASKYYSKYSANDELFSLLAESYPELNVSVLVPAEDYENTVYRVFGGYEKVKHSSTARYTYLDKINAYLLIGKQKNCNVEVKILSVGVCDDTYRMNAELYSENTLVGEYTVVFRMREEKEPYIYALLASS